MMSASGGKLKEYLEEINRKQDKIRGLSDRIWECPETAFGEFQSEAALIDFFKSEGFVLGMGAKMFVIAGPVLVYGIAASMIYGLIVFIIRMFV